MCSPPVGPEVEAIALNGDVPAREAVVTVDVFDVLPRRKRGGRQLSERRDGNERVLAVVTVK